MKKNKHGFTLVEIIVVLVIIAILMALAVPAVMSYMHKAADTKLISEARSVMIASKEKGITLVKEGKLNQLSSEESKKDIIAASEIDGTLLEIQLNAAKNGAGSFVVQIEDSYIRYDDVKQNYEVLDSYNDFITNTAEIRDALLIGVAQNAFKEYFKKEGKTVLNSEGANKGSQIRSLLRSAGLASGEDYSFRVYKNTNTGVYTITISDRKINMNDIKNNALVNVVQYVYANKDFLGDPIVKTAKAKVTLGEDSKSLGAGGTQEDYAALDLATLTDADWEIIEK